MRGTTEFGKAVRLLLSCSDPAATWCLVGTLTLSVSAGLLAALGPVALKHLVDAAAPGHEPALGWASSPMTTAALAYLLCIAATRLLAELRPLLASGAEQRLFAKLRIRLFEHALAVPLAFHLDRRSGSVVHSLQQGIVGYQIVLVNLLSGLVPVLVEGTTMLVVLHSLQQPMLTLVLVTMAVAYLAATLRLGPRLRASGRQVVDASASATGILADSLVNIEAVKCFGSETQLVRQFTRSTTTLTRTWADLHRLRLGNGMALIAVFTVSMGMSLAIAFDALRRGTFSVGGFVLAAMYMVQLVRPLDLLATASRDIAQALAFIKPLVDLLEEPREPRAGTSVPMPQASGADSKAGIERRIRHKGQLTSPSGEPRCKESAFAPPWIRFDGITLAFDGGKPVLNNLTLDIHAGRSTGIVGASGSGKTSLMRILLRLCVAQRGSVLIDGTPTEEFPVETLRSMIAVIPQDTVLFNTTVSANIAIGKDGATAVDIERAARLAELHDIIAALPDGYDTVIGERGLKLSGGERQRIAIARAVLRDPRIYVLDEATSMLDCATEDAILRNLRRVSSGRTTISIAHRMSALKHVDEIVVLVDGKVAEQGEHDVLLARNGHYARMWRDQRLVAGRPTAPV